MRRALRMVRHSRGVRAVIISFATLCLAAPAMPASAGGVGLSSTSEDQYQRFALHLTNCARTGGYVRKNGDCVGYGSGRYSTYRRPLRLSEFISDNVARSMAIKLARGNDCTHYEGSRYHYSVRFARAHIGRPYGESIGCGGWSSARQSIVSSFRIMQAEKPYNGWHWRNMKNRQFKRVGISVAKLSGRTRIVYDFAG